MNLAKFCSHFFNVISELRVVRTCIKQKQHFTHLSFCQNQGSSQSRYVLREMYLCRSSSMLSLSAITSLSRTTKITLCVLSCRACVWTVSRNTVWRIDKYRIRHKSKQQSDKYKFVYLRVGGPELQLSPHRVNVSLAQHNQGSSAGLNWLDDLVRDRLTHLNVKILWLTLVYKEIDNNADLNLIIWSCQPKCQNLTF